MIAICPPQESGFSRSATTERSGSLRRIDEVLGELLAGYGLTTETSATETSAPEPAFAPLPFAGAPLEVSPVGMLVGCER